MIPMAYRKNKERRGEHTPGESSQNRDFDFVIVAIMQLSSCLTVPHPIWRRSTRGLLSFPSRVLSWTPALAYFWDRSAAQRVQPVSFPRFISPLMLK